MNLAVKINLSMSQKVLIAEEMFIRFLKCSSHEERKKEKKMLFYAYILLIASLPLSGTFSFKTVTISSVRFRECMK